MALFDSDLVHEFDLQPPHPLWKGKPDHQSQIDRYKSFASLALTATVSKLITLLTQSIPKTWLIITTITV